MKKYLYAFVALTAMTAAAAFADEAEDPKRCYRVCMEEFKKDKEICNWLCKGGPRPAESKMRKKPVIEAPAPVEPKPAESK
ncbi:MAG: hypothetical protein V4631_13740 [Pseudomonadota bacterium]